MIRHVIRARRGLPEFRGEHSAAWDAEFRNNTEPGAVAAQVEAPTAADEGREPVFGDAVSVVAQGAAHRPVLDPGRDRHRRPRVVRGVLGQRTERFGEVFGIDRRSDTLRQIDGPAEELGVRRSTATIRSETVATSAAA